VILLILEKKELDDLVSVSGRYRLPLRNPCMEGTRLGILQEIETGIESTDGHNLIWIRGSPGVGKSALAASITSRLQGQGRRVIWFRFDRTQSTTITTEALWRVVAYDFARWYPSLRQQLAQGNRELSSSNIDHLFKTLIEEPLSTLHDIPHEGRPVIVIDALDECGGLRHDSSGMDDYESLLRTLKHWALVDCLRKFKLIITSRPENPITQTFPESISTHVNIPSGNDVKPGDGASNDIQVFLVSRLNTMGMDEAWVNEARDYLVPRAAGVFIWVTTVAKFLQKNPKQRFDILKTTEQERGADRFEELYSLYSTVIKTSFSHDLEGEEVKAVTSVIGATIFAKQPLDDTVLMKLPGVDTLKFIRDGLVSVIDSCPILRFHHRSFEDFLLSSSFKRYLPNLSGVQDRNLHERQLAMLCLNTMVSSKLCFNICNLESSSTKNADIPAADKSALSPLISYSSQFWADHLVQTQPDEILMKAVEFVMYEKLLFWIEVMSILGKAHEVSAILKRALEWLALTVCLKFVSYNTTLRLAGQTLDPRDELRLFIRDALRFISAFIIPISESASHIYLSALPFTPECSVVGGKFRPRFPNTLTISDGRPSQWPMNIFVAEHDKDPVQCVVFSPDDKTFVYMSVSSMIASYVCDSETGHCISGPFELSRHGPYIVNEVEVDGCFSSDGKHILVRFRHSDSLFRHAVVWDIARGEEVFQIEGFDFVFIYYGRHEGRIASVHWIDEDGSLIRKIVSKDQHPTRFLVKVWDIGNDISDRLFEVTGVAVTQFSPNGQYLAVGKRSENVVELWNLEDGKITHRFLHPPGNISSLHFPPTSDCLMAVFKNYRHQCLWRLDTQEMTSFSLYVGDIPPAIIHSPNANCLFVPRDDTVEIWEVSMSSSNMIFKTEPLTTWHITSICLSHDGHRVLVGSSDGTVRMLNMEDFGSTQPIIQDVTNTPRIIAFSPSGKIVAMKLWRSTCIELRDTTTWKLVGSTYAEYKDGVEVAFSADDKWIAVLADFRVTICDIMHPENCHSFDPWPKGRRVRLWKAAFQTCNDLVICAQLVDLDSKLQVWKVKDHSECTFSLDIDINGYSPIFLAPDGLTLITQHPLLCYSWNHDTAQFDHIHFTDEAHLMHFVFLSDNLSPAYSPDGKFFACRSNEDKHIRVWDTRTGQLCGKPITMPDVQSIALSPALNDQFLGDRLIAINCYYTISLFDVYTSHLYGQCWEPGRMIKMAFIGDGTNLASYSGSYAARTTRIGDIVGLTAKYRNAIHGYEPVPQSMKDGWMVGQDDELLFWVLLEHREDLCLPHVEMIGSRPTKVDLSRFRYGSKWTECIDQAWLKQLEERGRGMTRLLK